MKTEIADPKAELLKWLFGLIGLQTLVIVGTVVGLARAFH